MKKEPYLYTAAFVMVCSMSCMGLCIPLLAMWLGATYQDLGIIGAVSSLTYTLACLASGRLSDRLGYQRYFSFSAVAIAISITLYIWTTSGQRASPTWRFCSASPGCSSLAARPRFKPGWEFTNPGWNSCGLSAFSMSLGHSAS